MLKIDNQLIWIGFCQTVMKRLNPKNTTFEISAQDIREGNNTPFKYFTNDSEWRAGRECQYTLSPENVATLNKLKSVYNADKQISFIDVFYCCMKFVPGLKPDYCLREVDNLFQRSLECASPELPMFEVLLETDKTNLKDKRMEKAIENSYGKISYSYSEGVNVAGLLQQVIKNNLSLEEKQKSKVTKEYVEGKDGKSHSQYTVDITENSEIMDYAVGHILNESKQLDILYQCSELSIIDFMFLGSEAIRDSVTLKGDAEAAISNRIYYNTLSTLEDIYKNIPENDLEMINKFLDKTSENYLGDFRDKSRRNLSYLEDYTDFVFVEDIKSAFNRNTGAEVITVESNRTQNQRHIELTKELVNEILTINPRPVFFFKTGIEKVIHTLKVFKNLYDLKKLMDSAKLSYEPLIFVCKEWERSNQFTPNISLRDIYGDLGQRNLTREVISSYIKVDLIYRRKTELPTYNINPDGLNLMASLDSYLETHNPNLEQDLLKKVISLDIREESFIAKDTDTVKEESSVTSAGNIFAYDLTPYICLKYVCNIVFTHLFKSNFDKTGAWLPYAFSYKEHNDKVIPDRTSCDSLDTMLLSVLVDWNNKDMLDLFALLIQLFQDEVLSEVSDKVIARNDKQMLSFATIMNTTLCNLLNISEVEVSKYYYGNRAIHSTVYELFNKPGIKPGDSTHIRQSLQKFLQSGLKDWKSLFDTARKRLDELDPDYRFNGVHANPKAVTNGEWCNVKDIETNWSIVKQKSTGEKNVIPCQCHVLRPSCRIFAVNWDPLNASIAYTAADQAYIQEGDYNREHNYYTYHFPGIHTFKLNEYAVPGESVNQNLNFVRDYPFAMFKTENNEFKKLLFNEEELSSVSKVPQMRELDLNEGLYPEKEEVLLAEGQGNEAITQSSTFKYYLPVITPNRTDVCITHTRFINKDSKQPVTLHVLGHNELLSQSNMWMNIIDYGSVKGLYYRGRDVYTSFVPMIFFVGGHKFICVKDNETRKKVAALLKANYKLEGNTYTKIPPQLPGELFNHFNWKNQHNKKVNDHTLSPALEASYNSLVSLPIKTTKIKPELLTANFAGQIEQQNTSLSVISANTELAVSQSSGGEKQIAISLDPFELGSKEDYQKSFRRSVSFVPANTNYFNIDLDIFDELSIDKLMEGYVAICGEDSSATLSEMRNVLELSDKVKELLQDLDLKESGYLSPTFYSASPSVLLGRGSLEYLSYMSPGGGAPFYHELKPKEPDTNQVSYPAQDVYKFTHPKYSELMFIPPEEYTKVNGQLNPSEYFVRDVYDGRISLKAMETKMVISSNDFLKLYLEVLSLDSINFIKKIPNSNSTSISDNYEFNVQDALPAYAKSITEMRNRIALQRSAFIKSLVTKNDKPTTETVKDPNRDNITISYKNLCKDEMLFNSYTAISAFKTMQDKQQTSIFQCKNSFSHSKAMTVDKVLEDQVKNVVETVIKEYNEVLKTTYTLSESVCVKYASKSCIPLNGEKYEPPKKHLERLLKALEKGFKAKEYTSYLLSACVSADTAYTMGPTFQPFEDGPYLLCKSASKREDIMFLTKDEVYSIYPIVTDAECEVYTVLLDSEIPLCIVCTEIPGVSIPPPHKHNDIITLFENKHGYRRIKP